MKPDIRDRVRANRSLVEDNRAASIAAFLAIFHPEKKPLTEPQAKELLKKPEEECKP